MYKRQHVSDALAASGSNCGWYITSGDEPYSGVQYGFKQAVEGTSRDKAADSIEELAAMIKCDPAVLRATFDRYSELVDKGVDLSLIHICSLTCPPSL